MNEEGTWIERELDEVPEVAKPKARAKKAQLVVQQVESLPHSPDAEQGILSCLLQSPSTISHFRENGNLEWFYNPIWALIAGEMFLLHAQGKELDTVVLSQHFLDKGIMDQIGGPSTLAEILNFVPTAAHYHMYLQMVKEKALLRTIVLGTDKIRCCAMTSGHDLEEVSKVVVAEATGMISLFHVQDKEKTFEDHLVDTVQFWQDTKDHKIPSSIPSPWPKWNYELGGIRKGYALLMGPRKSGKSSLAKDLCLHAALNHGKRTDYFSYEMSEQSIIMRMVADLSGCDSRMVFSPDLFPPERDEERKIARAFTKLSNAPLRVTHKPGMDVDGIAYRCKKWQSELVVVDYLQLLPKPPGLDPKAGYEQEVSVNSRRLQVLCGELNNSLFVLGQLNKDGESRWSSGPENDIDLCLRIEPEGILVKSQRNGPSGMTIPLAFNPSSFRFEEVEELFPS